MIRVTAVSRRELFRRLGLAGAGALLLPELDRVLAFQRDLKAGATPAGALSASEAATLAAICARLIPTDENGPGAAEARASVYIDRALTGWLAPSREAYSVGLVAIDDAARARGAKRFVDLTPAEQDAVLRSVEDTPFFALVRTHTLQGTFCDPAYGGNANFVGWDLIGYPGVRLNVTPADQRMGTPITPVRRSAYDYAMFAAGAH
jgi:gluconate 2-dehydrogenase gamma chain